MVGHGLEKKRGDRDRTPASSALVLMTQRINPVFKCPKIVCCVCFQENFSSEVVPYSSACKVNLTQLTLTSGETEA